MVWSSDASPFLTNSMSSRFPIAILPASRYAISSRGVNLTLEAAAQQVTRSCNKLSTRGVKLRNIASLNAPTVPCLKFVFFFEVCRMYRLTGFTLLVVQIFLSV